MAAPISILLYGQDPVLLSTRQWVLSTSGHQVFLAADFASASRILKENKVDLLILCQTLTVADRDRAIALTIPKRSRFRRGKAEEPATKHLILTASVPGENQVGDFLDAMEGPAQLVSKVRMLFGHGSTAYSHFY